MELARPDQTTLTCARTWPGLDDLQTNVLCAALAKITPSLLETLDLKQNLISSDGAGSVSKFLLGSPPPPVTALDLADNELDSGACAGLAAAISQGKLATFSVRGNQIDADGLVTLCTALAGCDSLKVVDLGGNPAHDAAAPGFAGFLRQNTTAERASLANCGLSDEGCRAVRDALKGNGSLTQLDLSGNQITNDGARQIPDSH
eukprot:SAG22_NODE_2098_length_3017_cov_1.332077_1_plen_204_part_00